MSAGTVADKHFSNSFFAAPLTEADPEIAEAVAKELGRQQHEIELIASENIVSKAVMEAQGSVMTNKYAEGYPGKRWYGGCEVVDQVEQLAIDRVRELFGAAWANVQPHSGSSANLAVYNALIQPGDTVVVFGAGPVGIMAARCAWLFGAGFAPLVALALTSQFGLLSAGAYLLSGAAGTLIALWINKEMGRTRREAARAAQAQPE